MKILLLNYEFPPLGGGAAKASERLVHGLATLDPDLSFEVIAASPDRYHEEYLHPRIRLFRLDVGKRGGLHYQRFSHLLSYLFKADREVTRLAAQTHYDLIHAFFAIPTGFIPWRRSRRPPYLISLRGSDVPGYNRRFRLLYPALTPLIRRVCRNAAAVTANSEGLKDLALQSFGDLDIHVIPNGIEADYFKPPATRAGRPLNILFVGRLIRRKGVEYLLEAFSKFRGKQDAILTIAGTGNLETALKKQTANLNISGSTRYLGDVRGEALLAAYQSAHVFVLPSLNEGMSNALLEAMACALPVIVTDTGGTRELLSGNGILVKKKSSEEIYQALQRLCLIPELMEEMGQKSRRIAEGMGWDQTVRGYYSLYRKIMERPE